MRRADGDVSAVGPDRGGPTAGRAGVRGPGPGGDDAGRPGGERPAPGKSRPTGCEFGPDADTGGNKDAAHACYLRGVTALEKGDNDAAIAQFTEAIRLDPGLASAYADRARAESRKNDLEKTLADSDAAIRLDPAWARPMPAGASSGCPGLRSIERWPI